MLDLARDHQAVAIENESRALGAALQGILDDAQQDRLAHRDGARAASFPHLELFHVEQLAQDRGLVLGALWPAPRIAGLSRFDLPVLGWLAVADTVFAARTVSLLRRGACF